MPFSVKCSNTQKQLKKSEFLKTFATYLLLLTLYSDLQLAFVWDKTYLMNISNVSRVAVLVSDWLNGNFRGFSDLCDICKHTVKLS